MSELLKPGTKLHWMDGASARESFVTDVEYVLDDPGRSYSPNVSHAEVGKRYFTSMHEMYVAHREVIAREAAFWADLLATIDGNPETTDGGS